MSLGFNTMNCRQVVAALTPVELLGILTMIREHPHLVPSRVWYCTRSFLISPSLCEMLTIGWIDIESFHEKGGQPGDGHHFLLIWETRTRTHPMLIQDHIIVYTNKRCRCKRWSQLAVKQQEEVELLQNFRGWRATVQKIGQCSSSPRRV